MDEKRKFIRFRAPLEVKYGDTDYAEETQGLTKDISMGGVRISVNKPSAILPESLLSIQFSLDARLLRVSGKVVWVKDYGDRTEAGVSFVRIPDSGKEKIYNYIFTNYSKEFTRRWWQM